MNDKKQEFYTISWTQCYPEWRDTVDNITESMLEYSKFKEANELIEKIKSR